MQWIIPIVVECNEGIGGSICKFKWADGVIEGYIFQLYIMKFKK